MNMTTPTDLDGQPLELLIKLMRMTQAEDNIALVAVRKANAHLSKMGTDWEALLRGKVKIIADPFANINIPASHMNPNRNQEYTPPPPKPQRPSPPPPTPPFSRTSNPTPPPRRPQPAPRSPLPEPGPGNGTEEKRIVNKFDGTCYKCQGKVLAGQGLSILWKRSDGKTKWVSEHSGKCPPPRAARPARTTDNFQV